MKSNRIRSIFKRVYNNLPNPIFCYPLFYFQHGEFICEVATSINNFENTKWSYQYFKNSSPLLILEGLFFNQGYWITVLQRTHHNEYIKTNLNTHFDDWKKELNKFINTKLNTN
jgi:hypothetical protein